MKPSKKLAMITAAFTLLQPLSQARITLSALPERGKVIVRMDNANATMIEEERILTLQQGLNKVDFSWKGVHIDMDSIRLTTLSHPDKVQLLNVSYPPNENALVWEVAADGAFEEKVRISYLLSYIDRLVTFKGVAAKDETTLDMNRYLVLRNFSGEDFADADILLKEGNALRTGVLHEETKQLLFSKKEKLSIEKVWKFDARNMPWDPEKVSGNVGIPVVYNVANTADNSLGQGTLDAGKIRVYQQDGSGSVIFLGEDKTEQVPVGEKMEIYIGDSRDIVVTQRKMSSNKVNIRRNHNGRIILYDQDEHIHAEIENFKDKPAVLTMIQQVNGEWQMRDCNFEYKKEDYRTLEFRIELPPNGKKELTMKYRRLNIRE